MDYWISFKFGIKIPGELHLQASSEAAGRLDSEVTVTDPGMYGAIERGERPGNPRTKWMWNGKWSKDDGVCLNMVGIPPKQYQTGHIVIIFPVKIARTGGISYTHLRNNLIRRNTCWIKPQSNKCNRNKSYQISVTSPSGSGTSGCVKEWRRTMCGTRLKWLIPIPGNSHIYPRTGISKNLEPQTTVFAIYPPTPANGRGRVRSSAFRSCLCENSVWELLAWAVAWF